jgi:two-component system NarL family sensor kinase
LSDASTISDVADAMPLARSVVNNLRRTCLALRPSLLEELGLADALQWLARQTEYLSSNKLKVVMQHTGSPDSDPDSDSGTNQRASDTIELAFYRVAQEALTNVLKHAQAHHVTLQLEYRAYNVINLVIVDDGQGFRMGCSRSDSLGIVGMHERMGVIGGYLDIHTHPGQGTIVHASYAPQIAVLTEHLADRSSPPE